MTDNEIKAFAMRCLANHIETGSIMMSGADLSRQMAEVEKSPAGWDVQGMRRMHRQWIQFSATPSSVEKAGRLRKLADDIGYAAPGKIALLTPADQELVSESLLCWKNYIETGSILLSLSDVNEQVSSIGLKRFKESHPGVDARVLSFSQKKLVDRIASLTEGLVKMTAESKPRIDPPPAPAKKSSTVDVWGKRLQIRGTTQSGQELMFSVAILDEFTLRLQQAQRLIANEKLMSVSSEISSRVEVNGPWKVNAFNIALEVKGTNFQINAKCHDSRLAGELHSEPVHVASFLETVKQGVAPDSTLQVDGDNVFIDKRTKRLFHDFEREQEDRASTERPRV